VKAFTAAKGRLAPLLSPDERVDLARWMAERVLAAAGELATFVACDDDDVADWARTRGAQVLWKPRTGLNSAVTASVADLHRHGVDTAVVAHSDLPGATDLASLARPGRIVLVPDHARDGTNVIVVPTSLGFEFSYGASSFRRHLDQALATGLPVEVRHDRLLARDVDRPGDLTHPLLVDRLPAWLRTNLANLR
jgi:2-phospho-L-lactate guanylyltransferase